MQTYDKSFFHVLSTFFMCVLLSSIFISGDSLWIDEGNAAYKALQSSIGAWWETLVSEGGSDAQMPGYMFFIWVWAKVAGGSELALRMSNLVWIGLIALILRKQPWMLVALLSSAFVLYYANELRPYMMQIAATTMALEGIRKMENGKGWWLTLGACLLLCASSLTGVIWTLGILLFIVMDDFTRLRQRWFWKGILVSSPLFLALGIYYLRSLMLGQGAAQLGASLFTSMSAVVYELLGMQGLGPARIELRENPKSVFSYAAILVPAVAIVSAVLTIGAYQFITKSNHRRIIAILCGIGLPMLIFASLIFLKDFRVLGRHMAPLSVIIALCTSHLLSFSMSNIRWQRSQAILAWAAIMISLFSATQQRFSPRHRKDDYRGAASMASQAMGEGRTVVWLADTRTAHYYAIYSGSGLCQEWNSQSTPLPQLKGSEQIIMGKPDIYDPLGNVRRHLEANGFEITNTLQAFTIWEKQSDSQQNELR